MDNPILQAQAFGQSVWYDNIRRDFFASGRFDELLRWGITGVTSNPTIFEKALASTAEYDAQLAEVWARGASAAQVFEELAVQDIRMAADALRGVYERTEGRDGFASYELPPDLSHDEQGSVREALRLFRKLDRPNIMIKVPATEAGIRAVRRLIGAGVNVNITLIFSLAAYQGVMEAYLGGLEDLAASGGEVARVGSVASFFVSRVDTAVDARLRQAASQGDAAAETLTGKAAVANAHAAYARFRAAFGGERFAALERLGARPQRPLWASTSTKDPAMPDTLYFDELVGPGTVNTMPDATVEAVLDHGRAETRLDDHATGAKGTLLALASAGVDMEAVTARLLAEGIESFATSYRAVIAAIEEKCAGLPRPVAGGADGWSAEAAGEMRLGEHRGAVAEALTRLDAERAVERVWAKDHTLWNPDPAEIADRLGWLTVTDAMRGRLGELEEFAAEVKAADYRKAVLLAMGGSAFAPELYRSVYGCGKGCPEFEMLDSTTPGRVQEVTAGLDPARTLFIVSSKSGGTVEVISFYRHFRALADAAMGRERAGANFIAITDPGSVLEELAREEGFRRVFLNPADIGGRFSGQSLFGLVPGAVIGMDLPRFLASVEAMRRRCEHPPAGENPGARLGAALAALTQKGVDKLELVASPSLEALGLWTEQLIAESLGKDGKGIVPIAGEPPVAPGAYNADRLFVYIRLAGDDNGAPDERVDALAAAGRPVVRLDLEDVYELGGELYRWEFATAIAGALLGVHPFDQPNVQEAKDIASAAVESYERTGALPEPGETPDAQRLLGLIRPGDYVAFQVYQPQSAELDAALGRARRAVVERFGVAAAAGYGPRYLHSTGQLHKAGPDTGVFFQVVGGDGADLPIPGRGYSFRVLAQAQADGDLRSLQQRGRRVARIDAGEGAAAALDALVERVRRLA